MYLHYIYQKDKHDKQVYRPLGPLREIRQNIVPSTNAMHHRLRLDLTALIKDCNEPTKIVLEDWVRVEESVKNFVIF